MTAWIVPATVGAFVVGALCGVATRPAPSASRPQNLPSVELKPRAPSRTGKVPRDAAPVLATTRPAPSASEPVDELKDETPPSPWLVQLRRLAERVPRRQLTRSLWQAIWGDKKLERKTFECSKKVRSPETLDALLFVLDNIKDEGLRSDIISEMHHCTDPVRRRFLAGIIGARFQKEELLDEAMNLLKNPDPEVVKAALDGLMIGRFEKDQKGEASRTFRDVARRSGRMDVRAAALGAMSESTDPSDLRFLMDELVMERDPGCRNGAIRALSTFKFEEIPEKTEELAEAIRLLWRLALDPLETPDARSWARSVIIEREPMSGIDPEEWERMIALLRRAP